MTAISTNRGRRAFRSTLALGAVSLGLVTLSACQQPTPNAHFTINTNTTSRETPQDCYGHGDALGAEQARSCTESTEDVPSFTTRAGDTFRVGVDPDVAHNGWLLFVNGLLYDTDPFTTTYQTFASDDLYRAAEQQAASGGAPAENETLRLNVVEVSDDYDADEIFNSQTQEEYEQKMFSSLEGVWNVELEPHRES
ncbi:hypothetical protein [Streptomyces hainanensis]|uniref:DUF2771 domain-containing protein n=1 Tax=Streptomyces hainanensis TaxID=402648 RepID=A0A4R4TK92_9ACTN|nr:hypothetical protein [Streptomyces hainanensis]TDC75463.1 hypothetical protein E1283_12330 [Streptomyces hainanensis]